MMATHDNAPPPEGWRPEPRPWSERNCCTACGVCESDQHHLLIHGTEEHLIRGED